MKIIFVILVLSPLIFSCSWLGKDKEEILPGDRIPALSLGRSIVPDPTLKNVRIILPSPTFNQSWPQAGGYANHAMHHIAIRDNLEKKWSTSIGEGRSDEYRLSSEPVTGGNKVFTMDSESIVTAINFKTGNKIWELELTPEDEDDGHIGGGLAYNKGSLYITTGFAKVFALNAANGKILWMKNLTAPLRSSPTIRGGRVFVISLNNEIFALNAKTGKELWKYSGLPETASMLGAASPAVDNGIVIAPFTSGQLVALRVDNGRLLWEESLAKARSADSTSTISDIRGRPIIDRGRVIATSNGGQIVGIELRTGKRIWTKNIGSLESPWVAGEYIFSITNQAEVVCLSRQNGKVHWVTNLTKYEDPENLDRMIIWTGPILASDRLIVAGSNGIALALSPYSGKILGHINMPDGVSIPPVIANGNVLFLADDANLEVYQ